MTKRLVIIDGNSLINRAYYALPELMNKDGLHTNALYGFTTMLFKIMDNYEPTHMSVAFDLKAPTFRHKAYSEYKAHRKGMPDELREQMAPLKELLDAFKIHRLELEGFEADDIIGTVAREAEREGFEVFIVTGDKDALQLASANTKILITKKGISELEEYDGDAIVEKFGITPNQLIDLKGLMGDKSDNIPGVPGIGEKTGIKLIKEYGSVENLIQNTEDLKGKMKEKLEENVQLAVISKKLAKIVTDIPVEFDIEGLEMKGFDREQVLRLFNLFEFSSLVKRFGEVEKAEEDVKIEPSTLSIVNADEKGIEEFVEKVIERGYVYLKSISKGENIADKGIIGIFMSIDGEEMLKIDSEKGIMAVKGVLESSGIEKYGYKLKDDYINLRPYGVCIENLKFDISVAEYIIDSASSAYEHENISSKYFGKLIKSQEELLGKGKKAKLFEAVEPDELAGYFGEIINLVSRVKPLQEEEIAKNEMEELFYGVEMPLVEVLGNMEYEGIKVDREILLELKKEFAADIKQLEEKIYEHAGEKFNINSPKQLGVILFEKLELPPAKKTKTGYSTNAQVLEKLSDKHPLIDLISEYRQIVKLQSTYVDGLLGIINEKTGRIHSSFNQTITTTGRISSTEPNLQNIPVRLELGRKLRKVFIAKKNCVFTDADYSQIELRILAHICDDEKLKDAFIKEQDIHSRTASEVFGVPIEDVDRQMRGAAKAVNFGIIYGISDFGLSKNLGIPVKKAKEYINGYLDRYENVRKYMDDIVEYAKDNGYVLTLMNRRRYIPELRSSNFILKNLGKRLAMNTPIQGSAADIIKIAMVNVHKKLREKGLRSQLILQVHDELIIETYAEEKDVVEEILRSEMEGAMNLAVPLKVDLSSASSWYDAK